MTQNFNISEQNFDRVTFGSGGLPATITTVYSEAVNGQLLDVQWSANVLGSLSLKLSGTNIEVWRRNAPSGTGYQMAKPRMLGQTITASGAGGVLEPFYVNDKIAFVFDVGSNTSANISGTTYTLNFRYR